MIRGRQLHWYSYFHFCEFGLKKRDFGAGTVMRIYSVEWDAVLFVILNSATFHRVMYLCICIAQLMTIQLTPCLSWWAQISRMTKFSLNLYSHDLDVQSENMLNAMSSDIVFLESVNQGLTLAIQSPAAFIQEPFFPLLVSLSERSLTSPSTRWNAANRMTSRLETDVEVAITNNTIIWYLAACRWHSSILYLENWYCGSREV